MKNLYRIIEAILISLFGNFILLPYSNKWIFVAPLVLIYLLINLYPSLENRKLPLRRLRICADGCELLILFLLSTIMCSIFLFFMLWYIDWQVWLMDLIAIIILEAILFWNGILRVYLTSVQLGMRWRVIGIVFGWIPIAHLYALYRIIKIAYEECSFESHKIRLNESRKEQQLCATKYPLLLIHGVFFRDYQYLNYWGRIPKELETNGACIYYGEHQSAASIANSGEELAKRVQAILQETGCEKVNIIAHSKGGLDARYMISKCGMAEYVASLTTINTPHKGCVFCDYLLSKIANGIKERVARTYNAALRKMGDHNPDFLSAVYDLTASSCQQFNEEIKNDKNVHYQSVGSCLAHATGGRFPLNFSNKLVKYFDGRNDGLVSETSFPWGDNYIFLMPKTKRGISHGDMIDLNRENISGFDVREFYVQLVHNLKMKGF